MVRPQTSKRSLIIAIVIGFVSLAFFSFLFIGKQPSTTPTVAIKQTSEVQEDIPIPGLHRVLYDKPADIVPDIISEGYSIFTSYRLGVRFSYYARYLNDLVVRQKSCNISTPGCNPVEGSYTEIPGPVELGNTISFDGQTLYVFDKDPNDTFTIAIQKTALGGKMTCTVKIAELSQDGVEKATVAGTCGGDFVTQNDGGHFFMYPNYKNVFFFVRGKTGTKPLFNHKGSWIDSMLIRS